MKILAIKLIGFTVTLIIFSQSSFAVTEICVKKQIRISGHVITLADVAQIRCDNIEIKNRLKKIIVGHFPSQSKKKLISIKAIAAGLSSCGISPLSVDIYGATVCQAKSVIDTDPMFDAKSGMQGISNINQIGVLTNDQLMQSMQAIEETISPVTGQPLITVEDEIKKRVVFESGLPLSKLVFEWNNFNTALLKMPLEVGRYRFDAGRTVDIGNISFRITDLKSKRKNKKSLTAKVYYLCDTVIAKYDLKKNEVITEMNVELSQVKILSKRDIGVSDIMQVLNQQVRTPMRKGETIHFNKIKRLDLVHKGDIVKVLHSVGNIKMDFSGYAQKTGARGDIITVVNVYDKRQKNIVRVKASGIVVVLSNIVKEPIAQNNLNSRSTYK